MALNCLLLSCLLFSCYFQVHTFLSSPQCLASDASSQHLPRELESSAEARDPSLRHLPLMLLYPNFSNPNAVTSHTSPFSSPSAIRTSPVETEENGHLGCSVRDGRCSTGSGLGGQSTWQVSVAPRVFPLSEPWE